MATESVLNTPQKPKDAELNQHLCASDGCNNITYEGPSHSILMAFCHWSKDAGYAGVHSIDLQPQDFACSHECAVAAAHTLINEAAPDFEKAPRLNHNPLQGVDKPLCGLVSCSKPLTDEAYHIAVHYAKPGVISWEHDGEHVTSSQGHPGVNYSEVLDGELWGCSLDHAKQIAHAVVDEVLPLIPHAQIPHESVQIVEK